MTNRLIRTAKRVYPRLGLRKSDLLLASFPKSGNTWLRFIWANLISLAELEGREIDFHVLNRELAAEYDTHSYGALRYSSLPRLVKTHRPFDSGAFGHNRRIYLYRHPGDVAVSYFSFLTNSKNNPLPGLSFADFLRNDKHGIPAWCRHVAGWRPKASALVSYEALKNNAARTMRELFDRLGLPPFEEALLGEALQRSSFQTLKALEEKKGRPRQKEFDPRFRFMRRGRSGEWKAAFQPEDRLFLFRELESRRLSDLYEPED